MNRRDFLVATSAVAGGAVAASGTAAAQQGGGGSGGTTTVQVGAEGNGGNFAFAPAEIQVAPGTTVVWEWTGEGGAHNVVAENGAFDSGAPAADGSTTFEHTFSETGEFPYVCEPHESLGMTGTVTVGRGGGGGGGGGGANASAGNTSAGNQSTGQAGGNASAGGNGSAGGNASAGGNESAGGNQSAGGNASSGGNQSAGGNASSGGNQSASGGGSGGGGSETVQVGAQGNGGYFAFAPEELTVAPGTTVTWQWTGKGGAHNVVADDDSFSSGSPVAAASTTFTHTFSETGEFPYHCDPHESLGMVGTVTVQEGGASSGGGGGSTEVDPEEMGVPLQAHFVGIATLLMMVVSLVYTFFLVKYGESPNAKRGN